MKIHQSRPEFYSHVARVSKSLHQPPLKDLIQAHFRGISSKPLPSYSSQPIQRLVLNQNVNPKILYVSQSWLDEKYEEKDGQANKDLLDPAGTDFNFKSVYKKSGGEPGVDFLSRIRDSWKVNSSVKVKKVNRKFKLLTLFPGERNVGVNRREWLRMDKEFKNYVSQNHILYDFQGDFEEITGKPVFHLFNYTDPDSDSKVNKTWEDGLKSKVCVLISMIYERALAAGNDATTARKNIEDMLKNFGVSEVGSVRIDGGSDIKLPGESETYRLVEILHKKLQETNETKRYDLSYVNESILEKQYSLVAAPNCRLYKLGEMVKLPVGTYIFHVGNKSRDIGAGKDLIGHATTVKVLREIEGKLPSDEQLTTYFDNYNEGKSNFRGSALAQDTIIGSIWKKK